MRLLVGRRYRTEDNTSRCELKEPCAYQKTNCTIDGRNASVIVDCWNASQIKYL